MPKRTLLGSAVIAAALYLTGVLPALGVQEFTTQGDAAFGMRTYHQELQVEFNSPADAAMAKLEVAPVYGAKTWAFTARWDDNNYAHFHSADTRQT